MSTLAPLRIFLLAVKSFQKCLHMHKNFMNIKIRNTGTVIVKKKKKKVETMRTKDHAWLCYK
jgi:hypothetical protein